jgi:very-short-patch-repair endonuclease
VLDGVPITSIHRTLLDYAEVASRQQVRLAVEAAERLNVFDLLAMNELLGRSPGRRGLKVLKELLAELTGPAPWTQSELERQFLALIRTAGLPEPEANVLVGGELVDFYWPGHPPLVVELDGYQFHRSRAQFEKDRRRDAKLQLLGCRVVRITQRRLKEEPEQVIRELTRLLYGAAA